MHIELQGLCPRRGAWNGVPGWVRPFQTSLGFLRPALGTPGTLP